VRCPLCPDSVLVVSHRHGIEVDHCPTCRGVWLDRGELEHLVASVADRLGPSPGPAPSPGDGGLGPPPREAPWPPEAVERPEDGSWRDPRSSPDRKRKKRKHSVLDLLEEVLDL
jgi:uncharacterized protein